MKWYFSPQLPGHVETEVTQRDQFSNDEVEISETIVREAVQNSLDAAVDEPARVEVSFRLLSASDGLDGSFLRKLMEEQLEHAAVAGLDVAGVEFKVPEALVIEDFGTKGLTGSINQIDDDNFSDFWRRHGKSHKTGKSRGRWGLGKLVYSTSSDLGVFFGATVRDNDSAIYIMGQTVLNLREVRGRKYPPHAFFADLEGSDDILTTLPVPLREQELIDQFCQQFSLDRKGRPGLSVMIPFPNRDFRLERMVGVAIVNYFYPLITGQLVLRFGEIEINSSNIRALAHVYAAESFHDIDTLFDFIEQANRTPPDEMLTLKESWADDTKLDDDDFDAKDLEKIRKQFANGDLVGLRLPLTLKTKNGELKNTEFLVFIQRPPTLSHGLDLYVRGGLTVPGESKFGERKALGAMIAEDYDICSFLGDAENAAHTKWIGNAEKLKKNYRNPQPRLKVIKNAVLDLYNLLAGVTEEKDEQALQAFFWVEEPESAKKGRKKRKTPVIIPPIPSPKPRDFQIMSSEGGFSLRTVDNIAPERLPQTIKVEVAYDVASGNPWKKYNPLDFKLGKNGSVKVAMTKDSGKLLLCKENQLKIEVHKAPFKLKAAGFDDNRDLKIKVQKEAS